MGSIKAGDIVTLKQGVKNIKAGTKLKVITVDNIKKTAFVQFQDGSTKTILLKLFVEYVAPTLFQLLTESIQYLINKVRAIKR